MYYLKASKRNHHFTQWKMLGRVLHFVHSAQHSVGLFSYIILYCIKLYWNFKLKFQFSSVQSLSRVWLFATPGTVAHWASLSLIISQSLLKLMFVELVMPSNHLILCCPFSSCPQSFPASVSFQMREILVISLKR